MNRRAAILIALIVAGVTAYSAWWFALARSVAGGVEDWAEARRADGWTVAYGAPETSGFPFRLILSVPEPRMEAPLWSWSGPVVRGVVKPWSLGHVVVMIEGRQDLRFRLADAEVTMAVVAETALASFRIEKGVAKRVDIDVAKADIAADAFGGVYTADRFETHFRANAGEADDRPPGSADYALSATGVRLPDGMGGPLGNVIPSAMIRWQVKGNIGTTREALAGWRDDGGTVELESAKIAWGTLDAQVNATLALDKSWRPLGAGTLRLRGYERTIDAVESAKLLRPVEAGMLRLALRAQAKRDGDPRAFVDLPVTAQDGRLFVGPVPIVRLQPLFGAGP